ncbi:hypothetical protein, partial [Staphylococcus sp. GDB8P47P]|uniref:hypothetical protein n=1 Tax=Staphylococcus sp. GDB8P47P TaxID=2804448 RepID=UPI00195407EB
KTMKKKVTDQRSIIQESVDLIVIALQNAMQRVMHSSKILHIKKYAFNRNCMILLFDFFRRAGSDDKAMIH